MLIESDSLDFAIATAKAVNLNYIQCLRNFINETKCACVDCLINDLGLDYIKVTNNVTKQIDKVIFEKDNAYNYVLQIS